MAKRHAFFSPDLSNLKRKVFPFYSIIVSVVKHVTKLQTVNEAYNNKGWDNIYCTVTEKMMLYVALSVVENDNVH